MVACVQSSQLSSNVFGRWVEEMDSLFLARALADSISISSIANVMAAIRRFASLASSVSGLWSILDAHKLTGPNYADWLRNLRIVLRIEKLEYVIDSPKPTEPASDAHNDEHVVYRKWIDDANVAQCIMLASMNIEL
ncbi:hypothetical protein AgCh_001421 [Apium graveolens]